MKTQQYFLSLTAGLMILACGIGLFAGPMGTAFTYQGRLLDDNIAADGLYDMQFKLYDDPNALTGLQIGSTLTIEDVGVIDGYFVAELDFGGSVFDGNARWLEIGIRPGELNDPNVYTALNPRQRVTPTPYAMYAKTAGGDNDWMVSGNDMYSIPSGNIGIGTSLPRGPLDVRGDGPNQSIYLEVFTNQVYIGDKLGNGDETLFTVDDTFSKFTFENGNVGIGTTNPGAKLEVAGDVNVNGLSSGPIISATNTGIGDGLRGEATGSNGKGVYGIHSAVSGTAAGVHGVSNSTSGSAVGVVGEITSTSPGVSSAGVRGINNGTGANGSGVWGSQDGSGWGVYGTSVDGRGVFGNATGSGSATNYGGYFSAFGTYGRGVYGYASGDNGRGVYGYATGYEGAGLYGETTGTNGNGVEGWATGSGRGVYGRSTSGTGVDGMTDDIIGTGVNGYASNTGIETNFGVKGVANGQAGRGVKGQVDGLNAIGVEGVALTPGTGTGVYGSSASGTGGHFFSGSGYGLIVEKGNVGISNTSPNVSLDVIGDIEYTGTITDVSDERLKENIVPVDSALDKIQALKGVYFNMLDTPEQTEIGLIAQNVQEVLPEAVSIVDPEKGYLGVSYQSIIPILIEAIKDLKAENNLLKQRVESLEDRL